MFPLVRDLAAEGIPVRLTCGVLGFSAQAFYKWRARPCSDRDWADAHAINPIVDIHANDPEFGYRFIADELEQLGQRRGLPRVWLTSLVTRGVAGRMFQCPRVSLHSSSVDVVAIARRPDAVTSEVCVDFGISTTTLRRWLVQADIDDGIKDGLTTVEQDELVQLRRRPRRLEQENEVLRRAAAYFAADHLPK